MLGMWGTRAECKQPPRRRRQRAKIFTTQAASKRGQDEPDARRDRIGRCATVTRQGETVARASWGSALFVVERPKPASATATRPSQTAPLVRPEHG
jgi:hypothetical protein